MVVSCISFVITAKTFPSTLPTSVQGITLEKPDGEGLAMLELWGMRNTPLLPSVSGPILPGVIELDRVLSMGQIELNCRLMLS